MSRIPVRFGTSGWRGVLGDGFTFDGARAVVRAVADRVRETEPAARRRVVVAHDTRFLGEQLTRSACAVLRAAGVRPVAALHPTPTPVASYAVRSRRAAAGIVFTASHNPPEYQGLKVVSAQGGAAPLEITRDLEARVEQILAGPPPPEDPRPVPDTDLIRPYLAQLAERLGAIPGRTGLRVVYDALHGSGAGVLDAALVAAGIRVRVRRADPDPRFGGGAPDPVAPRLRELIAEVRRSRGAVLGLATDGDADRFAAVDRGGRLLRESEALALLVDHLARTGRVRRGVAVSLATGSLVERVARAHGLPVEQHPIGFKHLTRALVEGRADVAGEESGGFAWAPVALDKDGILAGCLLAELAAAQRAPLARRLAALRRAHGGGVCGRTALPAEGRPPDWQGRLRARLPARLDGVRVCGVDERDGLRLELADGFLLLRGSGTEPVMRVYAEAPDAAALARRLGAGERWLRTAGARRRS